MDDLRRLKWEKPLWMLYLAMLNFIAAEGVEVDGPAMVWQTDTGPAL
jgi:hypothetical protein